MKYLIDFYRMGFVGLIWGALNDISFLAILSLISITVPGIARSVNKIILGFVYMDLLQTHLWIDNFISFDEMNDYSINAYFEDSGF